MKILQVCPRYHPYIGGVERVVKNVAEYLAEQNHQVTVYATDPSNKLPQERVVKGVKVKNFFALAPNEAYHFPHPKMLIHLLKERADIIHAHSVHDLTILTAYAAYKVCARPRFVVSPYYHGKGHTNLAQILWIPFLPLVKKTMKEADAIIVNSKVLKDVAGRMFKPCCRIFLVYDGVNLNGIRDAKPFNFGEDFRVLLYVGRLEKYKNVHIIIASMKHLPKNYHFFVIGSGPLKHFLENCVQSTHLRHRVHFLGYQSDAVVFRWLKTAHVFVHLSAVESFGMTCIESLAAGTPVVANRDNFGLSETISMYPNHIAEYKMGKEPISKLAGRIMEVAELKPIRADVSQFSWAHVARSIGSVYKQVSILNSA